MSHRFTILALLAFCLTVASPDSVHGQSSEVDEIKSKYLEEVAAAERNIKEKYVSALERIQQQLQSQAKLEAALAVKREREKIQKELAADSSSNPPDNGGQPNLTELVFKPDSATPVGDVEFVEKWDALTGWRNQGSGASWDFTSVPGGVYSVLIEYAGPFDGGVLKAEQGSAAFEFAIPKTGDWVTYKTTQAGQINVNPSVPLKITVINDGGSPFGLLHLRSITLKPL